MVRASARAIAPINVCRRRFFARNQVCVSLECVQDSYVCVCVCVCGCPPTNQTPIQTKQSLPRPEEERKSIVVNQRSRFYLNNAHERKIIIRIKSKVVFLLLFNVSSSALQRVCNYFTFFISSQRARALGIYFCFVLLSIFFFFSFPLPTCLRDFFLFL